MIDSLVTIKNLCVSRGGKKILEGVHAHIQRGKITGLIGLNGCGKSTMLRALVREYPFTGSIEFHCGHDHSHHRQELVGYVPQKLLSDGRIPLTVRELFAVCLQKRPLFLGIQQKTVDKALELLNRVGARHLLDRPVAGLSGGEMQRVLLSLALDPQPELLLLDEPAAGIDFVDMKPFYQLIKRINSEKGTTVLLVSHDIPTVAEFADHILCMKRGKIIREGPPSEVLPSAELAKIFAPDGSQVNCDDPLHPGCVHF